MVRIHPDRWDWCGQCDGPCISCDVCGFSSCSGCGCDSCRRDFDAAIRIINGGKAPTYGRLLRRMKEFDYKKR